MAKKNGTEAKDEKKAPTEKKISEHIEQLPVKLTDTELLDRGQKLAKIQSDLAEHYANEESIKKQLKSKEAALEAERSKLAGAIRSKAEPRDVRVEEWARFKSGVIEHIRMDTGEVIFSRDLMPSERQTTLPLKGEGREATPEEKKAAEQAALEKAGTAILDAHADPHWRTEQTEDSP